MVCKLSKDKMVLILLSEADKERQKIKDNTNSVGEFGKEEYDKVKLLNKIVAHLRWDNLWINVGESY